MLKDQKFLEDLGLYFKEMRKKAGLSQVDVAQKLGYSSAQFVSNWERGLAAPPLEKLSTIIKIYNGNPNEVFQFILRYQERILKESIFGAPAYQMSNKDL